MSDLSKIKVGSTTYDIKDTVARANFDNFVEKTGDTMTGDLSLSDSNVTKDEIPTTTYYGGALHLSDSNDDTIGFLGAVQYTNGTEGIQIGTVRTINNADYYHGFKLKIGSEGSRSVEFDYPAVWRSGLDAQATLISGTNIKTVNNISLLGSGNIEIAGSDNGVDPEIIVGSTQPTNTNARIWIIP